MTDGYSMSGSQANRLALNPGGTLSGGKRFSVAGPVCGGPPPKTSAAPTAKARQLVHDKQRTANVDVMSATFRVPIFPSGTIGFAGSLEQ
jgi:hypothetical protein